MSLTFRAPLLLVLGLLASAPAAAQLSVELLTVEPGGELWERFGHTALRVRDGERDLVFSYGAAPFFDPRFIWSFARGEGDFLVIAQNFVSVVASYHMADRTLQSQELAFPMNERRAFVEQLYAAIRPPDNRYRYDQLYDNCATRVRDLIDRASKGALTRAARERHPGLRYRDYTLRAMAGHPIGHWALDLLGGPHQDLPVNGYHEMFLPVHLRDRVAEARVLVDGVERPLAGQIHTLISRRGPALSTDLWRARRVMLSAAAIFALLVWIGAAWAARARALHYLAAASAAALASWSGFFGALVVPLTLLSHVQNFSPNENAWLFLPSDVLCAPVLWRCVVTYARASRIWRLYLGARLLVLVVVVVLKLSGLWPQDNWVFVAIAAAFLLPAVTVAFFAPVLAQRGAPSPSVVSSDARVGAPLGSFPPSARKRGKKRRSRSSRA